MRNVKTLMLMLVLFGVTTIAYSQEKEERPEKIERIQKRELKSLYNEDRVSVRKKVESLIRSRAGASYVFIGCRIRGAISLPRSAVEEVSVKTAGISAQYENKERARFLSRNVFYQ